MGIVRFGFFSSGWYSSGICPLHPIQNILASNLMWMLLFVMIVLNRFKSLYWWIENFNFSSYTQTNSLSRQSRAGCSMFSMLTFYVVHCMNGEDASSNLVTLSGLAISANQWCANLNGWIRIRTAWIWIQIRIWIQEMDSSGFGF